MSYLKFIGFCFQEINFAYIVVFCFVLFCFFVSFLENLFLEIDGHQKASFVEFSFANASPIEVLQSYFQWRIIANFDNSVLTLNLTVEIIQSFQEIFPNSSLRIEVLEHFEEFNLANCHKQQYFPKFIFGNWGQCQKNGFRKN